MSSGTSYNGWPANSDPAAIGVEQNHYVPGGIKTGDVETVMAYVAREFNARVEPIVDGWCWGYTYKANVNNPSQLSCHASGTAIDLNAPDHPNGSGGTFNDAQVGTIYSILAEVQGAVDWLEGYDEMHFEIAVDAAALAAIAATLPASGPAPIPVPLSGDDVYQLVRNQDDGTLWAAAPGHFQYIGSPEYVQVAQGTGLLTTDETVTNNRGIDVLADFCKTGNYDGQPSAVVPN
jgi:hypothetical protein